MTAIEREGGDDAGRFVLRVDGRAVGELTWVRGDDHVVVADHTWVEPPLRGRGYARQLVDALVAWVRADGLTIDPTCWYVRQELEREPALQALIHR